MTFDEQTQLAQEWVRENGIDMIYPAGTKEKLDKIWENWQELSPQQKRLSDEKSIELFGMDNTNHYEILGLLYV